MFLEANDYHSTIRDEVLGRIIEQEVAFRASAELFAQELIESYLRHKYDVATIFSATGEARSKLIITYMIDIVLHTLHARITPKQIPDVRIERYENALAYFKSVAKGTISPDLPLLNDSTTAQSTFVSSRPKQKFDF